MKKEVLLITVPMSGYEKEIIKTLEKKGYEVDYFSKGSKIHKSEISILHRLLRGFNNTFKLNSVIKMVERLDKKYYQKEIAKLRSDYELVFDFGGKAKGSCLELLKEKYKKSKYVLYMWDDLEYANTVWSTMKFFDKKYIFNKKDSKKYGFEYLPNFFVDRYRYNGEVKEIGVFYKGSLRDKKRTFILEAIENELKGLKADISLFARGSYLKNIKKVHSKDYFIRRCSEEYSTLEELAEKSKKAKVILDIVYKNQSGLGLRPLEAIASNSKLVTTNKNILSYEFYNKNNIFYLKEDLSNLDDLNEFIKLPLAKLEDEVKYKYSIDGFIDNILQGV